jgi:hypothetical protein
VKQLENDCISLNKIVTEIENKYNEMRKKTIEKSK